MKQSLVVKYVFPFLQWYALMIFIAIAIDYVLHRFQLMYIGRHLGLIGTTVIVLSFIYSLRKRKIIESGSPKKLLALHEYLAWVGSIMLLVHAGIHFNALIPWLAILMLLIAVGSGLVGKFLLKQANETLKEKKQYLITEGNSKEELNCADGEQEIAKTSGHGKPPLKQVQYSSEKRHSHDKCPANQSQTCSTD